MNEEGEMEKEIKGSYGVVRSKFGRRFDSYYTFLLLNIAPKLGDPVVLAEMSEEFTGEDRGVRGEGRGV